MAASAVCCSKQLKRLLFEDGLGAENSVLFLFLPKSPLRQSVFKIYCFGSAKTVCTFYNAVTDPLSTGHFLVPKNIKQYLIKNSTTSLNKLLVKCREIKEQHNVLNFLNLIFTVGPK